MMWQNPPDNLILSSEEAHIWRADLKFNDAFKVHF
jgi:hypothetical protein